ncbi:DUF4133 domain-containing protein [[Flexibacter] sp. ATCC 35208]|uniref:DUF4133 domain-containing protein n=1 Tax=[Flexibacter] sp. ATCC 35208 TaxID=1936242 RepID=UPI0009D04707|nr:DUF4133 domain-containing protein [[Flexibacter] sp. ATCC 35208]OMP80084.1 hypothetical protein BW716_06215 [[Flexibacter] sp. ATCC 35208]
MSSSIYEINKGIGKSIEFKGFKAQYITYLAVGLVGLLVLFAAGYIAGVPAYVCAGVVCVAGFVLFSWVYKLSHKYGEHGLMVEAAFRQVPSAIICKSRNVFTGLKKSVSDDSNVDNRHGSHDSTAIAVKRK